MKVLILIPARGGSKGVPDKNVIPLMGKPLIGYTIEAARRASLADRICVSTEDEKIARVARDYGVQVIPRPPDLAVDAAPIEWALRHAVRYLAEKEGYSSDIVVWLQANVPLRKDGQIDAVVRKLVDSGADSVITVTPVTEQPEWMKRLVEGDRIVHMSRTKGFRRQDYPEDLYIADGAVIAIRTDVLMATEGLTGMHVFLGEDIRAVVEEARFAIEIDEPFDVEVAEGLLLHDACRRQDR
jgi:CMP-N,N'-diacetyllegionaminic acid synthase